MPYITNELSGEWLNYAAASLATRIKDAERATAKVLTAVQAIAEQLDNSQELTTLLDIEGDQALCSKILPLLQNVLHHLDEQDELSQLIAPLYMALQFEDRTRQKLEGLLAIMTVWAEVRNNDVISDEELAARLIKHVVAMEQQGILARYFPDYIQVEKASEEMDFF